MDIQNLLKSLYLYVLNVDECRAYNWNFKKITSPFTRLYLVKSGGGTIVHNHNKYELRSGRLYLIPSFTLCNYSSETFLEHYYIHFIPQVTGGTDIFKLFEFNYELPATKIDYELMKQILELNPGRMLVNWDPAKYCKNDLVPHSPIAGSVRQIANCIATQGILLQLLSKFIKVDKKTDVGFRSQTNSKIRQAVDYIKLNFSKQLNLSELAGVCHLSNDYFSRLFFNTMGIRPIEYINRKRIEEAQLQLVITSDPIEKIALDVGIDNFSWFNRLFKKYSCNTPGEYRILHRLV